MRKSTEPIVIRGLFSGETLQQMQQYAEMLKQSPQIWHDKEIFQRRCVHNDVYLKKVHEQLLPVAIKTFSEILKPSYNYCSFYDEGKGVCPLHIDRPQCYRTIDICLNQKEPWPIYISPEYVTDKSKHTDYFKLPPEKADPLKKGTVPYLLNPGDAVCYSGSKQIHWRDHIQAGNFCDLAFFHFVPIDFKDSLD